MSTSPELSPGLIVIHGNHLEELRALAVQRIAPHPLHCIQGTLLETGNLFKG